MQTDTWTEWHEDSLTHRATPELDSVCNWITDVKKSKSLFSPQAPQNETLPLYISSPFFRFAKVNNKKAYCLDIWLCGRGVESSTARDQFFYLSFFSLMDRRGQKKNRWREKRQTSNWLDAVHTALFSLQGHKSIWVNYKPMETVHTELINEEGYIGIWVYFTPMGYSSYCNFQFSGPFKHLSRPQTNWTQFILDRYMKHAIWVAQLLG